MDLAVISEENFLDTMPTNIPDRESPNTMSNTNAGYLAYLKLVSIDDNVNKDKMIIIINMELIMNSLYATF